MGLKYFCDRCDNEIPRRDKRTCVTVLDRCGYPVFDPAKPEYVLCERCKNKLKAWLKTDRKGGDGND